MKFKNMAALCIALLALMAFMPQLSIAPSPVQGGSLSAFAVAQLSGNSGKLAQPPVGLRVEGNTLRTATGERFIASGINIETWRDRGCTWPTDGLYTARVAFADEFVRLGINIVRMNYSTAWLSEAGNLDKFMEVAQELAQRGIYAMPSDHSYTGKALVNSSASFPLFGRMVDEFRKRGIEQYLVFNPFNEPGGDPPIAWSAWAAAQKNALTYLRNTAAFQGVVVLDTRTWALDTDTASFDAVLAHDATLRGGAANVVFSQHFYPTNGFDPVTKGFGLADKYPMLVGEAGQYNASPTDPGYVKEVIRLWFIARDAGHNGLFAWIANWCDISKQYADWYNPSVAYATPLRITSYGLLWETQYYSKLRSGTPAPTIVVQLPTATPTRSVVATNTPRISRTPPPSFTPTGTLIAPPATATPTCDAVIEQPIKWNGRDALATTCVRLR